MLKWKMLHPRMTVDMLGLIPEFVHESDPRSASEQINDNYRHGGGWSPLKTGWTMVDLERHIIKYAGDPPMVPRAEAHLRDELIVFYDHAVTAIFQKDGSFEVSRLD